MEGAFGDPAMAAVGEPGADLLLSPPSDAPIELATVELDLLAECVAQSAGLFSMRCLHVPWPACPNVSLKVGM